MRVVVTGGTGYLGGAIVRALHARGHRPVVFARHATGAALPAVAFDGDIRDRQAVRLALGRADAVIHAAALVSLWRPPQEFDAVNVAGLQNLLSVASDMKIPRLVYTSSFLALPPRDRTDPLEANDYQRTKVRALAVARAAADAGFPLVTLVPGVIYGPGAATEANLVGRLIRDHLAGKLPGLVGADRPWSYTFIDDVAAAHVAAVESPDARGEYIVGGENAPQRRVFEILRELTGRRLPRRIPFAAASAAAALHESRARWSGKAPQLTRGAVEIFRHDWSLDSSRSIAELSYRITPLEEGIKRTLEAPRP